MATTSNSAAAFESHVRELGLGELLPKMKEMGFDTYGDFGFAVSNGADSEKVESELVKPLCGENRKYAAKLRRLFAHSYTIAASETERFTSNAPEPFVRLHPAERESRRKKLAERLTGFRLEADSDPAPKLIDRCSTILATGLVRYIPWHRCPTAASELVEVPEVRALTLDPATGKLVTIDSDDSPNADVSSDLLLDLALRRRALAADISDLCSFEAMTLWHEVMKSDLLRAPPSGYSRVSYEQLRNADQRVWQIVAEKCREGCKRPTSADPTAFERHLKDAAFDLEIRLLLQPLPVGVRSSSAASSSSSSVVLSASAPQPPKDKSVDRLLDQLNTVKAQMGDLKRKFGKGSGGKSGGKGKQSGRADKRARGNAPRGLEGKNLKTPAGEPLCFGFNLGTCNAVPPGQRCSKGWHLCSEPGCGKPHSMNAFH